MIYLDNAATSAPKPPAVAAAMIGYLEGAGNPGRSGHRMARLAEEAIWGAREALATLFALKDPARLVFAGNATHALNIAIKGLVPAGSHVLTSGYEHNSVIRPLHALRTAGVTWSSVPAGTDSPMDFDRLEDELTRTGSRLVVVGHASNVTGAVMPLAEIRRITMAHQAILVVDAAQTAGHRTLGADEADVIVCAGHKGLLGPQGTGLLIVGEGVQITPLTHGGTGGRSESFDPPRWLPYSLESGTPNGVGIAGLGAAAREMTPDTIRATEIREAALREQFVAGVRDVDGVRLREQESPLPPVAVVSLTLDGLSSSDAAALLEERHDVLVRGGLHCAPMAHRTLGTFSDGTVRFSMSRFTTDDEINSAIEAVRDVAKLRSFA